MYRDRDIPEDETGMMPAYDSYVTGQMMKPEYRRIRIGLDGAEKALGAIASDSRHTYKEHALGELGFVLEKLQEVEALAEKIEDAIMWEYVTDYLEMLVDVRRYMVAELRWEVQSERHCPVQA